MFSTLPFEMMGIFKVSVTVLHTTVQIFSACFACRLFVPPRLHCSATLVFAFVVYTACSKFGQLILRRYLKLLPPDGIF